MVTTNRDAALCYLTVYSVRAALELAGEEHEIIVVAEGGSETKWENRGFRYYPASGHSPQASRDLGIREARSDTVLLLESHVVVSDPAGFAATHKNLGGAITFCPRHGETTELFDVYGSEVDWGSLWYKRLRYEKPPSSAPFKIAQFGHSCLCVDRAWYMENGGYGKSLKGWGAEEPLLAWKAWMLGREVWMAPAFWHAHWLQPGAHSAQILEGDTQYKRNFQSLGYVVAGRGLCGFVPTSQEQEERKQMQRGPFQGDIEKLRRYFVGAGVQC